MAHYQGLCYENMKKLKPMAGAGAGVGARVVGANTAPALSASTAPIDGGLKNGSEAGGRDTAAECGGGAGSAVASRASSSSSFKVDVVVAAAAAAAAAAAREIVDRFVKEGAPEQVKRWEFRLFAGQLGGYV